MRFDRLTAQVIGWANDRNLIEGSTVQKQNVKLIEEFGEFAAGLARGKKEVQADALGDMMVILIIMGQQADVNIRQQLADLVETALDSQSYDSIISAIDRQMRKVGIDEAFLTTSIDIGGLSEYVLCTPQPAYLVTPLATAMGDVIAMCFELELNPTDVLEDVWNIIKDRKGKMVDGVFVKENDAMMEGGANTQ